MTGLLVSVRDAEEAWSALLGGVDLLDVKEPHRGALGAADPGVWRQVLEVCRGRVPTSAALGELGEAERRGDLRNLQGYDYVKIGLAGCAHQADWPARWARLLARLPRSAAPVAVVYADWQICQAPSPEEVIQAAAAQACQAILFDTWDKQQGNLLDHVGLSALAGWQASIRCQGMQVVLAGSLDTRLIRRVWSLGADYLAVRGAACQGTRNARVDGRRVRQLVRLLAELRSQPELNPFGGNA